MEQNERIKASKRPMIRISINILILLWLFPACGTKQNQKWTARLAPESGVFYRYTMVNRNEFRQGDENKERNENTVEARYTYEVHKNNPDSTVFRITYDDFKIKISNKDIDKELDAAASKDALDVTERMFAAFKGSMITVTADAKGQVRNMTGVQQLYKKMDSIAAGDPAALQFLNSSIKVNLSEDFFRNTMSQNMKVFPDSAVAIGDSWMMENAMEIGVKTNYKTVYTLTDIKDSIAYIKTRSEISVVNQEMKIEDVSANVTLKGNQIGEIRMEQKTGMLIWATSELNVEGDVLVYGKKVPIESNTHYELKGVRNK